MLVDVSPNLDSKQFKHSQKEKIKSLGEFLTFIELQKINLYAHLMIGHQSLEIDKTRKRKGKNKIRKRVKCSPKQGLSPFEFVSRKKKKEIFSSAAVLVFSEKGFT